jgi:hypothetical protein
VVISLNSPALSRERRYWVSFAVGHQKDDLLIKKPDLGAVSAILAAMASRLSTEKNDWPTIFNVSCV